MARKRGAAKAAKLRTGAATLMLLPLLILAACAGGPPRPVGGGTATGSAASSAGTVSPAGAAAAPGAALAVARPDQQLARLNGLTALAVMRLLGQPDLRRREPPAEVWQYRTNDCVIDLFLYQQGDGYHVVYGETHDRGPPRFSQVSCLDALTASRGQGRGKLRESRL